MYGTMSTIRCMVRVSLFTKSRAHLLKKGWAIPITAPMEPPSYTHSRHPGVYFYVREDSWRLYRGNQPIGNGTTFAELVVAAQELEEQKEQL
jgi:hypothetical protein